MNLLKALFGGKEENPEEEQTQKKEKDFDVLKYDGIRALNMNQVDYAVKCLNAALGIKEDLETREYLAQALLHRDELMPAYQEYRKLAEAEPDNLKVWLMIAHVTYMMEDYGAMADACEKAMLIDDKNAEAAYQYARASIGQDDLTNGISMATKAISLNPKYVDAYLLRAKTEIQVKDYESADEDIKWLEQNVEPNEDVLLTKARLEKAKGNMDSCIKCYGDVIELNPFSIDAYRGRSEAKAENGDKTGAEEDAQKALELNPEEAKDEDIEQKTREAYRNNNPFGLG